MNKRRWNDEREEAEGTTNERRWNKDNKGEERKQ